MGGGTIYIYIYICLLRKNEKAKDKHVERDREAQTDTWRYSTTAQRARAGEDLIQAQEENEELVVHLRLQYELTKSSPVVVTQEEPTTLNPKTLNPKPEILS